MTKPNPSVSRDARVVAFPLGTGLYDAFIAAVRRYDPDLPRDALAEIPQSGAGLPREQALQEALRWVWIEDIPFFDDPRVQAFLNRLRGSHSPVSYDRLMLEKRVRKVLAALADELRNGSLTLTAIDPQTLDRVVLLPELLDELGLGHHRMREQIPTARGVLKYLRFDDGHDPAQGRLFDPSNPSNPAGPPTPLPPTPAQLACFLKAEAKTSRIPPHIQWKQLRSAAMAHFKTDKKLSIRTLHNYLEKLELYIPEKRRSGTGKPKGSAK